MKSLVLALAALVVAGCALVFFQVRAQDARMDALLREISATRAQIDRAHTDEPAGAPPAPQVVVGSRGLDARDIDAIAARVAAMTQAQAKTDALVAAAEKAPTPEQISKHEDEQRKVDAIIASGHERREDLLALRQELGDDLDERSELARQIAVAINTKKLVPDDPRAVFP